MEGTALFRSMSVLTESRDSGDWRIVQELSLHTIIMAARAGKTVWEFNASVEIFLGKAKNFSTS